VATARATLEAALADGREMLDETEAKAVLRAYGIPVVETVATAATADAAVEAAHGLGWPVVLKILSHDISHKSDVGGVALNLLDADDVRHAAERMLERVRKVHPRARLDGFTVQQMVRLPQAHELVVGARIDGVFGPVIQFGQGGAAADVLKDRATALPPLNAPLARALIQRTRVARLLNGFRDVPPANLDAVVHTLQAVSQLLADVPELAELDINPLLVNHDGAMALDARVRLSPAKPAGAARFAIQPYPAELSETLDWAGQRITVRPVRPEDEAAHREFVDSLAPDDLRMRYFHSRRQMERGELARLVQIDYTREMAFIATARSA
jgi:acetyltransferase